MLVWNSSNCNEKVEGRHQGQQGSVLLAKTVRSTELVLRRPQKLPLQHLGRSLHEERVEGCFTKWRPYKAPMRTYVNLAFEAR
jgi:hypothetical protein